MKSLFLYFINKVFMKKIAVLVVVAFIAALIVSSCNKTACPAYSKTETVQNNQVG
jgi:hypothetical protein